MEKLFGFNILTSCALSPKTGKLVKDDSVALPNVIHQLCVILRRKWKAPTATRVKTRIYIRIRETYFKIGKCCMVNLNANAFVAYPCAVVTFRHDIR